MNYKVTLMVFSARQELLSGSSSDEQVGVLPQVENGVRGRQVQIFCAVDRNRVTGDISIGDFPRSSIDVVRLVTVLVDSVDPGNSVVSLFIFNVRFFPLIAPSGVVRLPELHLEVELLSFSEGADQSFVVNSSEGRVGISEPECVSSDFKSNSVPSVESAVEFFNAVLFVIEHIGDDSFGSERGHKVNREVSVSSIVDKSA